MILSYEKDASGVMKIYYDTCLNKGQDPLLARKFGSWASEAGFNTIDTYVKSVNCGKNDKMSYRYIRTALHCLKSLAPIFGPSLGIPAKDYPAAVPSILQKTIDSCTEWVYIATLCQKP
ncbi:hypothetical protein BDF14DRAFT_719534 [Spinellus fusiger]|nr:hypothetical protein BDF14DRAFT_719534 [Spinellus fusiger]